MTDTSGGPQIERWPTSGAGGVVPAELFLDLAFVFCQGQITRLMANDLHWLNLLRGLLMVMIIWTIWVGFTWIGNLMPDSLRPNVEQIGVFRILLVMTVASLIVLGMAIPRGFGDDSWIFVGAFLSIALLAALSFLYVTRTSRMMRTNFLKILPIQLLLPASLIASAIIDRVPWSPLLITAGLISALAANQIAGHEERWKINLEHADERFRLFMFIVLGETIIAIGFGASESNFGLAVVGSVLCGVVFCTTLWWIYFGLVAFHGVRHLEALNRRQRARATRWIYTYLHGVLVVITSFLAVGLEVAASHPLHTLDDQLAIITPLSLSLFILTVFVIHYLLAGVTEWSLLIPAGLILFAIPLGQHIPAVLVQVICAAVLLIFVLGREVMTQPGLLPAAERIWARR